MNIKNKIAIGIICVLMISSGGVHANESSKLFSEFCNKDRRFNDHLIPHHDLPVRKYDLRHSVFFHKVNLLSFIKDLNSGISIAAMNPPIKHKTHIGVTEFPHGKHIVDFIIHVNPNEDFVSAFFSVCRDLVMTRKLLELINSGKISAETNYDDFTKLYKSEYKSVIDGLAKDFKAHFSEWMKTEGLLVEAQEWLAHEIKVSSMKNDEVPPDALKHMTHQIDIFYEVIPVITFSSK